MKTTDLREALENVAYSKLFKCVMILEAVPVQLGKLAYQEKPVAKKVAFHKPKLRIYFEIQAEREEYVN